MAKPPIPVFKVVHWLLIFLAVYALGSVIALVLSDELQAVIDPSIIPVLINFILIFIIALALRVTRWCFLLRANNPNIGRWEATEIYIGGFPMSLTPGRVGEIWRALALAAKWRINFKHGLSFVVCDRLLDLNAILLLASLGFVTLSGWYFLLPIIIFLPVMLLLLKPRWCARLLKLTYAIIGKRFSRLFAVLLGVCRHIPTIIRPRLYWQALLLSVLAWGTEAFAISLTAAKLGGDLPLISAMTTLGLGNIIGVITLLPGGIGGQEATMIYLIQALGNALPVAILITAIARIGTIFFCAAIGLPLFLKLSKQLLAN